MKRAGVTPGPFLPNTMQVIYEPHPVSAERKAALRAQGYKIIDARFAPPAEAAEAQASVPVPPAEAAEAEVRRRGRPPKAKTQTE